MTIELHTFTVTLNQAEATAYKSMAEHRAWVRTAVSDLSEVLRTAGMGAEARLRGHDRCGHLVVEATDTGVNFLRTLPAIVSVEVH